MNTAYFVKYPRTIDDLQAAHPANQERPYEIVQEIVLAAIDYENFTTDMAVDRTFLEHAAGQYAEGETMKCLLVRRRKQGGVLAVPENGAFVKWAAYVK